MNVKDCSVQNSLCSRIVKADYSGAKVKVVKSKNPAALNIEGIIVRETTRTFIVIQPDDDVKTVIKEGSVFQMLLPSSLKSNNDGLPLAVNIWGDTILYQGSERGKKKFKEKYNLELY